MKKLFYLLPLVLTFITGTSAFSQKYSTPADTAKLNKEYVKTTNEITKLTSSLAIAQNNLPGYQNKAGEAASDAQNTAINSSQQASVATNGNLGDAKKAKRKAKKALNDAKDSRQAGNKVKNQDKKIAKLSFQLAKKQKHLEELDMMRTTINAQL
jgi:uncharacterized coiled-coil protein SlyX